MRPIVFAFAELLAAPSVDAHEGLKAEIQALDARIAASPGAADLLVERARLRRLTGIPRAGRSISPEPPPLHPPFEACFSSGA